MITAQTKYFTVSEANKTLPLVKQIVRDILANGAKIKLHLQDHPNETIDSPEPDRLKREIVKFIDELLEIGCFYKDWNFAIGLVDFPSRIDGQEVSLCWRSDEEEILYYHPVDQGYKARRLIPKEYL